MLKLKHKTSLLYSSFAQESSQDFHFPLFAAIAIQVLSHLHTICLILISSFSHSSLQHYTLLPVLRDITCMTAIFPYFNYESLDTMIQAFYAVLICYFIAWISMLSYNLFSVVKKRDISIRVKQSLTLAFLVHSRVIFFPIHYLVLIRISAVTNCDESTTCSATKLPIPIIMGILNMSIAFCKEISFYQITKGKSAFSCKNNHVSLILLIQKTVITFLFAFFSDSVAATRVSAIINFAIFAALIAILYFKLPFYEMSLTQTSMAFSGISLVISFMSILKSCGALKDKSTVELILYLTSVLVVRVLLKFLQNLMFKILQFEYYTPEQAVHFPILIKSAFANSSPFPKNKKNFSQKTISYLGLLKIQGINLENETNIQYEMYTVVMEKFLKLLKKYPHSEVLRICMANIYLKKLKTGVKAVSLLRTIRVFSRSIPVKNSVETYVKRIEDTFVKYTQEGPNHLNVLNYFKYRDSAISMKDSIQGEVSHHIDFWKELTQEKVDIFKMINTAQKVNDKFLHIHKLWNTFIEEFDSHFGALTLMYGVYLQTVRDLPHEGWPIITDYFHHRRNKALNKANRVLNILSENAAIIVGSIETEKLGRVIDSSISVKSLFNIAKEKLIDQKVDILMPSLIAKRHDDFIHAYNKSPRLQMNTNMISLGRTIDGYFFSVEVTLKAFPFLQNGVCVIAFVEKTANREPMFVVGDKGVIVDSSKEIEGFFKVDKSILSKSKIQQFSGEFENILNAFNVSYNYSEKDGEVQSPTTNPTSFRDMHDEKNITLDPTSSRNFHEVETTDDQPLLESMLLSPPRSRRGTWKFSDAHLISPRKHFQLLANRASLMTKLTVDIPPKSSVRLPRDMESVIELCNKYKEGAKMALTSVYSVDLEAKQGKQYFVKVEPLFVGKSFYKVVKVKEVTGVTSIEALPASPRRNYLNFRASAIVKTEFKDDDSFADCFPQTSEKVVISQVKRDEPREKEKDNETDRKNCSTSLQMGYNSKGGGILAIRGDSSDLEFGQNQSQYNNHNNDNRVRNKPNEISSVKDSSSAGVRIAKTLNELFSNEKVRPATKLAIFVVYFAMLTVIAMSVVDYVFAGRSIDEMQAAVLIKNTVNKRLFNSVIAWQYLLLIYTSAAPILLNTIQDNVFEQTIAMLQQNDILKTSLQDMTNQRIVDIFFEKRVTMYDPTTQTVFNSEPMNALTAVSVLSVKNLIAANYTYTSASKAIKALQANPEIMFAMNNTANDYFVVSEQELIDTEEVIDSILLKNIQLLELILGFENLALFLLAFLLTVLVKVVITSHSKAFKALISIHQQSVHKKLNNLKIFSDYLQENIESKKLGYNLSLYLESLDKAAKNPQAKLSHVRYSEDKLVRKGLIIHMIRYLGFAFFFIFGVSGIFIYSFIASQKSFELLDSLNDNLSTTHDIGYKVNSILSNFCHLTLFYNRTDLPLRNNNPDEEITIEFQYLSTANSVLLDTLVYPDIGTPDPVIASFLRNDICSFFTDRGDRLLCLDASKDSPGLLSLNAKYIQLAMSAVQDFRDLPTQANGQKTFNDFGGDTTSDIFTLQTSYEFLTARLLKQFQEETDNQRDHRLAIFIGILVFISAITVIIHLIPINKFKKVDIVLRRVLKIIPYEIIRENKVFGFFLVNEFDKEVEGIKRYL